MRKMKKAIVTLLTFALALPFMTPALAAGYTVERGDSLWSIAEDQLGSGSRWKEIYQANIDRIKNPGLIYVGQELEIPGETDDFSRQVSWEDMLGTTTGTLTVDTLAEKWQLYYETKYGNSTLRGWYLPEDGTMEITDDAGLGAYLDQDAILGAAKPALLDILQNAPAVAADPGEEPVKVIGGDINCKHKWRNQVCIRCQAQCPHNEMDEKGNCVICDAPCTHLKHDPETLMCEYCGKAGYHTFTDGVCSCGRTSIFEWDKVDENYIVPCDEAGRIEEITYTTRSYVSGDEQTDITKRALVYLPYGYDAEKEYDILYLMHGGGDNETSWLVENSENKNLLDNMIKNGDCDPVIVVTPTFYDTPGSVDYFGYEFMNDLIPAVEGKYATYAEGDVAAENLKATRAHRAYAGLSMGSMTGWSSILKYCTDYVGYVGTFSGAGGQNKVETFEEEIAQSLSANLKDDNYEMYYWYNGNGLVDMAHDEHKQSYEEMLQLMPDTFEDGVNACWVDMPKGGHNWAAWQIDLMNVLRVFFQVDEAGEKTELEALASEGRLY